MYLFQPASSVKDRWDLVVACRKLSPSNVPKGRNSISGGHSTRDIRFINIFFKEEWTKVRTVSTNTHPRGYWSFFIPSNIKKVWWSLGAYCRRLCEFTSPFIQNPASPPMTKLLKIWDVVTVDRTIAIGRNSLVEDNSSILGRVELLIDWKWTVQDQSRFNCVDVLRRSFSSRINFVTIEAYLSQLRPTPRLWYFCTYVSPHGCRISNVSTRKCFWT